MSLALFATVALSSALAAAPTPGPGPTRYESAPLEASRDNTHRSGPDIHLFHGARVGYVYSMEDPSLGLSSHNLAMGYEWYQVVDGGSNIDFLFVQNILAIGMNQGLIIPAGNALLGVEINERLQLGVGPNLNLGELVTDGQAIGMVAAAGVVLDSGDFNIPVHVSVIPRDGEVPRVALTTGINW